MLAVSLTGAIPTNAIQSAAQNAMLPLVVFSLFFGFALTRIAPERRAEAASLGLRSIVAGTLATCVTGCLAGLFV